MMKIFTSSRKSLIILGLVLIAGLIVTGSVLASGSSERSDSNVYWSWDFMAQNTDNPTGTSKLNRTGNGLSASYNAEGLTPGNAVTLWFVVFNYPELCAGGPYQCSPNDMGNDMPAKGDFLFASGHVIAGNGNGKFGGQLNVGDTSRSGLAETLEGCQDCTPGLIEPESALVVLAIHDHGPRQTGQVLNEQISSFLGGCVGEPNGNGFGFAENEGDLPDEYGECSTILMSPHKSAVE
jgi:hypothetical protein